MRKKPDKDDPRFKPARLGGTGGFQSDGSRRFSALSPDSQLSKLLKKPTNSIDVLLDKRKGATVEATRLRARLVLDLAVERLADALSDDDNLLPVNELAQATNALTRIALPQVEGSSGPVTVTVVRVQAPKRDGAPLLLADEVQVEVAQAVGSSPSQRDDADAE